MVPILRDYCVACHNDEDLEGELSMETFAKLMKGGEDGPAILPGNAEDSLFLGVLTGKSRPRMPPPKEPKPSPDQIEVLRLWVAAGAKGPAPDQDVSMLEALNVPPIEPGNNAVRAVTAAAYSADGQLLALGRFGTVEILDASENKTVRELGGLPGKVHSLEFHRSYLVAASGVAGLRGEAVVWDTASWTEVRRFGQGHRDVLYDAEYSPDGSLLATAGYDRRITLWNAATGEETRVIEGHNGAVFELAFSPDGKLLASASADETVKVWRVADGERMDTLNQPQAEQFSVAFTPDGRHVLAGGADNRLRMWRVISREKPEINPILHARFAHEQPIVRIAVSPDGTWLASSSSDRTIKLWSLPDLEPLRVLDNQPDVAAALAIRHGAETVTAGRMDGTLESWKVERDARPERGGAGRTGGAGHAGAKPSPRRDASTSGNGAELSKLEESEPNDAPDGAQRIELPAEIRGAIGTAGDADLFRFESRAGESWVVEVNAARSKSPLDSKVEVLDGEGRPVEQVVLQAMRDSWLTFRGKDSDTANDFRVQNWLEMELNEYLYINGEVVRLWLYPRGPDSGFKVYPGYDKRHTYFGTTSLSHPLGQNCYIVRPLPAGSDPAPNGLPVFRLYFENDDDPQRRWGRDSQLIFTAPADGDYVARLRDVRGFGGAEFAYTLTVRPRRPDFRVTIEGAGPTVSPGSGKEFVLKAERFDGFDGEIRVDVAGLPAGFTASSPVVIEEGQSMAIGVLNAATDASNPEGDSGKKSSLTARAMIDGREEVHEAGSLGDIKLGKPAKVRVAILPDGQSGRPVSEPGRPLELTLAPGETITARVQAVRDGFENRIEFGTDDSGRNMPHGVYVDNIGLNGLLIVEGESERQFFITAAPWVPETTRMFHLRTTADGVQASVPVILHVRAPGRVARSE